MPCDASVSMLVDRLNDVDKRRRLTVMGQREIEARLQHATQEQKDIERQRAEVLETEAKLQRELDALAGQQKQMQLQLMMEADRVRHCDVEEPLLQSHAAQQLAKLESERKLWATNTSQLEQLAAMWRDDPCMQEVHQAIAEADATLDQLAVKQSAVEQETAQMRAQMAQLREAMLAAGTSGGHEAAAAATAGSGATDAVIADATGGESAMTQARDRLRQGEEDWQQTEADYARRLSAVQREVDDVAARGKELQGMLADLEETTRRHAQNIAELDACVAANRCTSCRSNKGGA